MFTIMIGVMGKHKAKIIAPNTGELRRLLLIALLKH